MKFKLKLYAVVILAGCFVQHFSLAKDERDTENKTIVKQNAESQFWLNELGQTVIGMICNNNQKKPLCDKLTKFRVEKNTYYTTLEAYRQLKKELYDSYFGAEHDYIKTYCEQETTIAPHIKELCESWLEEKTKMARAKNLTKIAKTRVI